MRESIVLFSRLTDRSEQIGGPRLSDTSSLLMLEEINPISYGNPVRVDQWYNSPSHQCTLSIVASNYVGLVYLEASIQANPSDNDWFNVKLDPENPYLTYPDMFFGSLIGETSNRGYNFTGRFTWLRMKFDTTYTNGVPFGLIDRVLVNI